MRLALSLIPASLAPETDEWMMAAEIRLGLLADRLGYDMVMAGERHFTGVGGGNPFLTLANLAPRLKHAWLGSGVVVVPNYHPVRLAEMINIIDHMAKGKAIIGLGSGMAPADAVAFGYDIARQADEMYHEGVEALLNLWNQRQPDEPVEIDTGHYKGTLLHRITPSPYRKTRPYIKTTASSPRHITRAAREGWPVFFFCRDAQEALEPFRDYRAALLSHGHDPETLAHCAAWTSIAKPSMHFAETDAQAEAQWRHLFARSAPFRARMAENASRAKEVQGITAPVHGVEARADPSFQRHMAVFGGIDLMTAHIAEMRALGIGMFQFGIVTPVDEETLIMVEKSVRLFAEQIIPKFRAPAPSYEELPT
jgi:alkanesulfonate monooxygenase SsuD/methylene tetrahydromethanopterin reductase-like flavin-dependent oxidoreductase (luciferase family)